MRCILFTSIIVLGTISNADAQDPIWAPDVANIIYTHCSHCHHDGGIAPFPLMSFSDAVAKAGQIANAVTTRHMPPWPADPDYRHFANENVLTQGEIDAIVDWAVGAPLGNPALEPDPPVFLPSGSVLDQIDATLAIEPYTLQFNTDEYRWFTVQNPSASTIYINKMEVLPGLEDIVHHCDISYDMTGTSANFDSMDPLPGFNSSTGNPVYSKYMNAWQPGGDIVTYPNDWGIEVPPNADFVFEIHYGPGGIGQTDSTIINLQYSTVPNVRPVQVGWTLGQSAPTLVDGPFTLPANTIKTYHQEYTLPNSRSYLAICPHMHQLGKSYKVWFTTPNNDSVPLVDIPQWDFHWQRYYYFQQVQVIPAGATIKSEVVYDNTMFNPYNPNVPPQDIFLGPATDDEMMLCYFIWADYQPGDENIIIDSTLIAGLNELDPLRDQWNVFPNPTLSSAQVTWSEDLEVREIMVMDALGRMEFRSTPPRSSRSVLDLEDLPAGCYIVRIGTDSGFSQKLVVKEQ